MISRKAHTKNRLLSVLCLAVMCFSSASVYAQSAFENPGVRGGSGGGLVPVDDEIDGGTIAIGSTAQIVVLFRNEGGGPVNTGAINLYPSSNATATVTMNQCGQEPIAGGADCAIAISVKGLQAGPWSVAMLMTHDGRSRLVSTVLSGSIESAGDSKEQLISDLEAVPNELDYGDLSASRVQLKSVTLRNITSVPIKVEDVYLKSDSAAGLSLESECDMLNAGQACIVTVKWSPLQKGPASGVVVVKHSGPTGITTVDIVGEFEPEVSEAAEVFPEAVPGKGLMISSLSEIDFGEGIDTISAITTSLVNSGEAALQISDISLSGSENGLEVDPSGCTSGTVLEPLQACPLTLSWGPVKIGTLLDDVKVRHTGARGVLVLPVRGEASEAVSKDSQSIVLNASPGFSLESYVEALPDPEDRTAGDFDAKPAEEAAPKSQPPGINKIKTLDGYSITSLAGDRAIITSPRGSRVIFNGEPMVIAGVQWVPNIQYNGVEFVNGEDKVLMLFDRSLSSFNTSTSQSSSASSSGSSTVTDDQ